MRPHTVFPPALDSAALLGALPELSALCTVETLDLMQLDSTDVTAADRQRMAQGGLAKPCRNSTASSVLETHCGTAERSAYTAALLTACLAAFRQAARSLTGSSNRLLDGRAGLG